jgi:hydrogenase nickel incorporation protein HypA/HybF
VAAVHELSLCRSISAIVERAAAGRAIAVIDLDVGTLRQVVPETLAYCWGIVTEGGALAGSELRIRRIEAEIACRACGAHTRLTGSIPMMVCGSCDSGDVVATAGEDFLVRSLDVKT